jgi:hypothetical protein
MSSTKHTPGPWELFSTGEVWSSHGHIVKAYASTPSDRANARLITAAPELLEVATMILFSIDGGGNVVTFQDMHINQLREAIEKATQP